MTSHELANKLLEMPNVDVCIPYKQDSFETLSKVEYHKFDKEFMTEGEPTSLIYLSGEMFNNKS